MSISITLLKVIYKISSIQYKSYPLIVPIASYALYMKCMAIVGYIVEQNCPTTAIKEPLVSSITRVRDKGEDYKFRIQRG